MDLKLIHNRLLFLANKEQNFWSRPEIDEKLHMAQLWAFNQYYRGYAKSTEIQDALAPFKIKYTFTTSNTPLGVINFNDTRYAHFLSLYVQYTDGKGRVRTSDKKQVNEDEIGSRLDSQLTPVTLTTPVINIKGKGQIQLFPELPNSGYAYYLQYPLAPNFYYTQVGRAITYDAALSTQLLWNETCINQIIIKTLQLLGINIDDKALTQFTQAKEQEQI